MPAQTPPTVLTVRVGRPRVVDWFGRSVETAIWKSPSAGRVAARSLGLSGDAQADLRVHGGVDKAVYAYAAEDYAWWAHQLGAPLEPGCFGENLTLVGVDLSAAVVGERWRIGSAVVEVSQPRAPCYKLGVRMGRASFVEEFERARRPGAYLRVVAEGDLGAGDAVELAERPDHGLTIAGVVTALGSGDPAELDRVAANPDLAPEWVHAAQRRRSRRS